jgi:hypothetical protein
MAIRGTRDSDHELECQGMNPLGFCINLRMLGTIRGPLLIRHGVPENQENYVE